MNIQRSFQTFIYRKLASFIVLFYIFVLTLFNIFREFTHFFGAVYYYVNGLRILFIFYFRKFDIQNTKL